MLWHFVQDFIDTPAGPVPRVATVLDAHDRRGALRVRCGFNRSGYRVSPGLYAVGAAGTTSPVLVTANYKLSFDALRSELRGLDAWILVLDTRGINVWCAAGKKTFSTDEIVRRVQLTGLEQVVSHRELIVPQLGAVGVAAQEVKRGCGFAVFWAPIRASDVKSFLASGKKAAPAMRRVTFTLAERAALIPVEIVLFGKLALKTLLVLFLLSGLGAHIFSFTAAWQRGVQAAAAFAAGILAGAVATPLLLPWLPGPAFWLKGGLAGGLAGVFVAAGFWSRTAGLEPVALFLLTAATASFMAMNFTGATPYTSASGVEKEMRRAIPAQFAALGLAALCWVGANFFAR